jgi:hypothetical protein
MTLQFRCKPSLGSALEKWLKRENRVCKAVEKALDEVSESLDGLATRIKQIR